MNENVDLRWRELQAREWKWEAQFATVMKLLEFLGFHATAARLGVSKPRQWRCDLCL